LLLLLEVVEVLVFVGVFDFLLLLSLTSFKFTEDINLLFDRFVLNAIAGAVPIVCQKMLLKKLFFAIIAL
jgi:hypothetical protein